MRGSLLLLFGAAAIYLVVALAIGLWISTLVETQQQAMFVTFFIVNVYLLMSGLFTPIDSMAPWVQTVSLLNPVRHFVTISRAILMKGAGLAEIARPLLILALYAVGDADAGGPAVLEADGVEATHITLTQASASRTGPQRHRATEKRATIRRRRPAKQARRSRGATRQKRVAFSDGAIRFWRVAPLGRAALRRAVESLISKTETNWSL